MPGRTLSLNFGGHEVCAQTTEAQLGSEEADADQVTFSDVATGNDRTWTFDVTGVADYAEGSLWSLLWDTGRFVPVPYTLKPYGDHVASPEQPHFTGAVLVEAKPPIGGNAGDIWTFEAKLVCTAPPVRVTS
jgi:hypothetical protein